ncbi:MAG: replicative DNA helicase [Patescibacteria group bacterium]|jgi:replicative DNA helicase
MQANTKSKQELVKSVSDPDLLPPQNLEAEESVLGGLLLEKNAILKVAPILTSEDFYRDHHGTMYAAALRLFDKRIPIDLITLAEELEQMKKLDQIGGPETLANLVAKVPSVAHITHYAHIVKEKAVLRRLITAANRIIQIGFDQTVEASAALDQSEQALFAVSQKFYDKNFIPIADLLAESFERVDLLHKNKGMTRGVPTGFKDLDNLLAGLQQSDLIILAARPSVGKTALALNMAEYAAVHEKKTVAVFSLEMSKEQLIDRLLCSQSGIDSWKLRTGNLNEDDFRNLNYGMGVLSEAKIFIDDSPLANVTEIRAKARRLQMEQGLDMIVIDYLQLMEGSHAGSGESNRVQEISEISRGLKGLARELNVPVLALSQLSRAVEQRHPKIPQLSDLRESGSIEQDADVVMFLYREDYYEKDTDRKNITDVLVRKHRNGPIGDISLFFQPEQTKYFNLDKAHNTATTEE